jgi:N-acyl-D-amino-acid deacylase
MYDTIIRNGIIYDGSGNEPFVGDVSIAGDKIAAVGSVKSASANVIVDATGLAIAPGFINVLSWANESLIADGRSQSDIRQGVTLEVMGEGNSMGPLNDALRDKRVKEQTDIKYDVTWTTLAEYLELLSKRGISTNIASFVGASTIRRFVLGEENRAPNRFELEQMCELTRQAMMEGALGVSSALIYTPALYAKTDELIALAKVAAEFGGMYISHLRSEGSRFLEALDEFLTIAEQANVAAEVYHLKAAGKSNWHKIDSAIRKIENARDRGLKITADMYVYPAAWSGLDAAMPSWVQEGGLTEWIERLKQPDVRARVKADMLLLSDEWENGYLYAGAEGIVLVGFKSEKLKPLTGKTLAEVACLRGQAPEETAMDLVIEDQSDVRAVYFWMSEENILKQLKLPWISFGSDVASLAPEGVFLKSNPHPRAYGNFARFLGKYVREEKVTTWQDAIRRLTSLPATNLKLDRRGALKPGYFADIVVFDPKTIIDKATFENPHQYSIGVEHVFVNGTQVLKDGEHTGALPGRVVWGPGRAVAKVKEEIRYP